MTGDAPGTPPAEVEIDEALISALLAEQHPDLAGLPVRIMGEGWDNVMARVGDALAVRMPRRKIAEQLLINEQIWLPRLAPHLPLPIPAPVRIGRPGENYPFTWSVVNWLPGEMAATHPPDASEAPMLARFLKAVHVAAPEDAPENPHRGSPLATKRQATERRMGNIAHRDDLLTPALMNIWEQGLAADIDTPRTWIAGDVHAQNVLVQDGKLSAFIDWGDMCTGDAATDLASIWMLFEDAEARRAAIEAYGMSDATIARAMGWAVFYGVILLETGLQDDPFHAAVGEATLRRLNVDAA